MGRLRQRQGLTLVEVLVVLIILLALTALALPTLLNQRTKGQEASAKSSAKQTVEAAARLLPETANGFPSDVVSQIGVSEPSLKITAASTYPKGSVAASLLTNNQVVIARTTAANGKQIACAVVAPSTRNCTASNGDTATYINAVPNPEVRNNLNCWSTAVYYYTGGTYNGGSSATVSGAGVASSIPFSTFGSPTLNLLTTTGVGDTNSVESSFNPGSNLVNHHQIYPTGGCATIMPVVPNAKVFGRIKAKLVAGSVGTKQSLDIGFYDSAAGFITQGCGCTPVTVTTGTWNDFTTFQTAPSNAAYMYLALVTTNTTLNPTVVQADQAMATAVPAGQTAALPFFDGDSPQADWSSTPHASTSTGYAWPSWLSR